MQIKYDNTEVSSKQYLYMLTCINYMHQICLIWNAEYKHASVKLRLHVYIYIKHIYVIDVCGNT